jgi:hypothetical protein
MRCWLCERDAAAGAKHCVAVLDLISEMQGGEGGEQQALAAKAVCVLALAALDGIAWRAMLLYGDVSLGSRCGHVRSFCRKGLYKGCC